MKNYLIKDSLDSDIIDERLQWCYNNLLYDDILKYEITDDNRLIIYGNIFIDDSIEEIPVLIDEVYGDVIFENTKYMRYGNLKNLKNCPKIIHGTFKCNHNNILSLKGGPEYVGGNYWCNNCNLKTLDGIAKYIGGSLMIYNNDIADISKLKDITIKGYIDIENNKFNLKNDVFESLKIYY